MKGVIMANSLRSKIKKLCHDNNISEKMCNELLEKLEGHDRELRAKAIDEFAEAIRAIHYKYPIGTDADTNEPLYGHEDGTWHNLLDDVAEQMKGE
jgi:hypothetical protein